jgi:hypothetical protein
MQQYKYNTQQDELESAQNESAGTNKDKDERSVCL